VDHIAPESAAFSPESRSTIVRFLRTIVQMSRELDEGFIRFVAFQMPNPGQDDGRDLNLALRCIDDVLTGVFYKIDGPELNGCDPRAQSINEVVGLIGDTFATDHIEYFHSLYQQMRAAGEAQEELTPDLVEPFAAFAPKIPRLLTGQSV
jgi:hypothetical protein